MYVPVLNPHISEAKVQTASRSEQGHSIRICSIVSIALQWRHRARSVLPSMFRQYFPILYPECRHIQRNHRKLRGMSLLVSDFHSFAAGGVS
jgi:hypothetical protein